MIHCKTWKHSSKIHFPHILLISSKTKALAQLVSIAQVSVRHFLPKSHKKTYRNVVCLC